MRRSLPVVCLLLAVLCFYPSLAGCGGSETEISFPYPLDIAEGNHLFVMGHHFTEQVTFTWAPGDSVRVEGMAVYPVPRPPAKSISEELLEETYGQVPFVNGLVRQGTTWLEATSQYEERRVELGKYAKKVYRRALERGASEVIAAQVALDSLDTTLFDQSFEVEVRPAVIVVRWEGLPGQSIFLLDQDPGPSEKSSKDRKPISVEDASTFVRVVSKKLGGNVGGVWMEVFSTTHVTLSGGAVRKALDQIASSNHQSLAHGPLFDSDLELILMRRED